MPRQPPSCSSTRCRSNVTPPPGDDPLTTGSPPARPGRRTGPGAQLVPGVVDDLTPFEGREAAACGEPAPGLDAGDPPPPPPDQGDRPGAVEELGLERGHRLARGVDHRLQPAGHGDDLALAAGADRG